MIICDICKKDTWQEIEDEKTAKDDITLKFHDFEFQLCINCAYGLGILIHEKNKQLKELVVKKE